MCRIASCKKLPKTFFLLNLRDRDIQSDPRGGCPPPARKKCIPSVPVYVPDFDKISGSENMINKNKVKFF